MDVVDRTVGTVAHGCPGQLTATPLSSSMQPAGGANLSATAVPVRPRAAARPTASGIRQIATYATTLAGIYWSVGFLFYFAMKEKLFTDSGTMPVGLQKAFHGSFFASIPGDNAAWVLLGLIEALVVVLLAGLSVSVFAYAVMIVANAMIGNNPTVIELFTYLGVTAVVMFLVRQMSPYRPMSWLAGESDQ